MDENEIYHYSNKLNTYLNNENIMKKVCIFPHNNHSPTGASIRPGPGVIKMAGAGFSQLF